ncbi:uncharacterized protein LOC108896134 [Lates japonicus]
MTALVKTLIPACPVEYLVFTNIPFLDKNNPDVYSTRFKEDFQPCSSKKVEPVPPAITAQVDHRDLRHIKEYLSEATASYHRHPLPQITRTPRWAKLCTNFKMQTDPGEAASSFLTTQSQKFQPQPFQAPPTPFRLTEAIKKIEQEEKFPESTNKATFTLHHGSPVIKPTVKHLEEGFPTIKGDGCHRNIISQYKDSFQGAWSQAAQLMDKPSSVSMGDPVKIVERETTHAASFSRPTPCSQPVVKHRLKLNLGNFSKAPWSSTSKEAFCYHKIGDPVVLTRGTQQYSSFPKGDTDMSRNKERMSVTTTRISFSELNHTEHPVYAPGPELMTKSNVQFSPHRLSGQYYTTTTKEHYGKQEGERARPAIQLPCKILSGSEPALTLSTSKAHFLPFKARKQTPCLSQQRSHIRFPLAEQHFRTTHSEVYTAKPLTLQCPANSQYLSHFVMK